MQLTDLSVDPGHLDRLPRLKDWIAASPASQAWKMIEFGGLRISDSSSIYGLEEHRFDLISDALTVDAAAYTIIIVCGSLRMYE